MIPSTFNPLMDINEAKTALGGPHAGPAESGGSERQPAGVEKRDGTAALGSAVNDKGTPDAVSRAFSGPQRQPSGVDRFNGGSV